MKNIKIANFVIGNNNPVFIIAEAGINHNGSFKIAKKMVDVAKKEKESMMANTYEEFIKFLNGQKRSLSTNFNDAIDAVETFEKYVFDKKMQHLN